MNSMYDYYNYMNNLDNYNNMNDLNNLSMISGLGNMIDMSNTTGLNNMMDNMKNYNYMNKSDDILDPYTGFIRGNMYSNLYDPYKNYQPARISAKSERDELLLQIQQLAFAMNDIALYLDVKENDMNKINLFNTYSKKKEELTKTYESKYGPLVRDYYKYNNWKWDNNPWPWEVVK